MLNIEVKCMAQIAKFNSSQVMIAGDFEAYHYCEPYSKTLDFHTHEFFECFLFLGGDVTYYIEDRVYPLIPGDLLLIPPGRMHRPVLADERAPYDRMVLWLSVPYVHALCETNDVFSSLSALSSHGIHRIHLPEESLSFCKALFERMTDDSFKQTSGAAITLFLNEAARCAAAAEQPAPAADSLMAQVLRYIDAHYTEPLTLDTLCAQFFVSKFHLLRQFKAYTNATVHDYIVTKRISYARQCIREGMTASDACMQAGFNEYSSFYKSFVQKTGMTPAVFKRHCMAKR